MAKHKKEKKQTHLYTTAKLSVDDVLRAIFLDILDNKYSSFPGTRSFPESPEKRSMYYEDTKLQTYEKCLYSDNDNEEIYKLYFQNGYNLEKNSVEHMLNGLIRSHHHLIIRALL